MKEKNKISPKPFSNKEPEIESENNQNICYLDKIIIKDKKENILENVNCDKKNLIDENNIFEAPECIKEKMCSDNNSNKNKNENLVDKKNILK